MSASVGRIGVRRPELFGEQAHSLTERGKLRGFEQGMNALPIFRVEPELDMAIARENLPGHGGIVP